MCCAWIFVFAGDDTSCRQVKQGDTLVPLGNPNKPPSEEHKVGGNKRKEQNLLNKPWKVFFIYVNLLKLIQAYYNPEIKN